MDSARKERILSYHNNLIVRTAIGALLSSLPVAIFVFAMLGAVVGPHLPSRPLVVDGWLMTDGVVVEVDAWENEQKPLYFPVVRFRNADGIELTRRAPASYDKDEFRVGQRVSIRDEQPTWNVAGRGSDGGHFLVSPRAEFKDFFEQDMLRFLPLLLSLFVGLSALLVVRIRDRNAAVRILENGIRLSAAVDDISCWYPYRSRMFTSLCAVAARGIDPGGVGGVFKSFPVTVNPPLFRKFDLGAVRGMPIDVYFDPTDHAQYVVDTSCIGRDGTISIAKN